MLAKCVEKMIPYVGRQMHWYLTTMKICVDISFFKNCFSFQIFFVVYRFHIKSFFHIIADFVPDFIIFYKQFIIFFQKRLLFSFIKISSICTHFGKHYASRSNCSTIFAKMDSTIISFNRSNCNINKTHSFLHYHDSNYILQAEICKLSQTKIQVITNNTLMRTIDLVNINSFRYINPIIF